MTGEREKAWIGLGSNLGDRLGALRAARAALDLLADVTVLAASNVYESDPVGPGQQGLYFNAALELETALEPRALLGQLFVIERDLGRDRSADAVRWGPRTLDLDLLLFGDRHLCEAGLEVPHPRLHQRPFVLLPLVELVGDHLHPGLGGRLDDWAARCPDRGTTRRREDLPPDAWAPQP